MASRAKESVHILEGNLPVNMIRYAIPLVLSGILQLLFNTADTVVVGRFTGSTALAAVGSTNSLVQLITNLFIGLSSGATVAVSQAFGAGDQQRISRTVHTSICTAIAAGILVTIIGVFCSRTFLIWMGSPDDVIELSALYLRIYFLGMTGTLVYNFGAGILRAVGDTRRPFYYLTFAGIVNVILNLFCVLVLGMGVEGVAIATAVSQSLAAVLVVISLVRDKTAIHLTLKGLRFYPAELKLIIRIGLPAGIQSSMFSIANVLIQSSVNSFGSEVMSGASAGSSITGFVWIAMNAFHHTALTFMGQNLGRKNYDRIGKIMRWAVTLVTLTGMVFGGLELLLARQLLGIFIVDSATAIEYGLLQMVIICSFNWMCGIMDTMTGALRGLGSSTAPMLSTILCVCLFRVIWIFTAFRYSFACLSRQTAFQVLYLAYPISFVLNIAAQTVMYQLLKHRFFRKNPEVFEKK